jgi:hypothetical protein
VWRRIAGGQKEEENKIDREKSQEEGIRVFDTGVVGKDFFDGREGDVRNRMRRSGMWSGRWWTRWMDWFVWVALVGGL